MTYSGGGGAEPVVDRKPLAKDTQTIGVTIDNIMASSGLSAWERLLIGTTLIVNANELVQKTKRGLQLIEYDSDT